LCACAEDDETEGDELCEERWDVAKAMMARTPRTFADLAYQAEAFLVADLEMIGGRGAVDGGDLLIRMLLHHIRALGALQQPDDPLGALKMNLSELEA
jgi:hypothetical protein